VQAVAVTMRIAKPEAAAEKESVVAGRFLMQWPQGPVNLKPMPITSHPCTRADGYLQLPFAELPIMAPLASALRSPREWFRAWGHFARNCRMTEIIRLRSRKISQ